MKRRNSTRRRKAFTLLELLLVMAILIGLASVVTVSYINIKRNSDRNTAKLQIETLETGVQDYYFHMNVFPDKLESLVSPPSDQTLATKWNQHGEFLAEDIPRDPWGNEYVYSVENNKVMIRSNGPDGRPNSDDDVTNRSSD